MMARLVDRSISIETEDYRPRLAIIVINEVFGVADHTKDVTDRLAAQGYVAFTKPPLLR